jgi:hypothetical protein
MGSRLGFQFDFFEWFESVHDRPIFRRPGGLFPSLVGLTSIQKEEPPSWSPDAHLTLGGVNPSGLGFAYPSLSVFMALNYHPE